MDLLECGGMRAHSIELVIEIGDRKMALIFVFIFESAVKSMAVDVADKFSRWGAIFLQKEVYGSGCQDDGHGIRVFNMLLDK
jgi:hypothetical protein